MHEQWCTIGSKKERRGIILSALKFSSQNQSAANWKKDAKNIEDAVAQKHKRLLKKIRPSTRHKDLFKQLHQRFATAKFKGHKVSYAWFYVTANKINKECMELTLPDC